MGYWLSRLVFTRGLALVYVVAFIASANQFRALIGERGMLPAPRYLARTAFRRSPSVFHAHYSDRFFAACCWLGAAISVAALVGLVERLPIWAWMIAWLVLWGGYLSIVNVGQIWYSFGWESLLVETGFLAVFLGPSTTAPPTAILWLLRWLLFRLEFGAGLIKVRGDLCWRDLTCLQYHHETQPMPNPLSWYFHRLPARLHRIEVVANHATQLIVVWALFAPQPVATAAALIMIVTQLWLMLSGNFSWLNALTLTIGIAVVGVRGHPPAHVSHPMWFTAVSVAVALVVAVLSYWPARNMLSRRQAMNASFNSLHLVNTYGAFGSVTRVRHEVIIEGTADGEEWKEYEFKAKPGAVGRRPPQIAPYHLRLDWLLWFVGISPSYGQSWLPAFLGKLLENDRDTLKLLRHSPFPDRPPAMVRARLYRYRFTTAAERKETGAWWDRDVVGDVVPPLSRHPV